MNKKVIISEIDEKSFGKAIVSLLNKEWNEYYDDNYCKDYCNIREATIDENNRIELYATVKRATNNRPCPCVIGVSFEKDLEEDAKDDDYIISIVDLMRKNNLTTFNEDLDTYKVKGSLKEGILYCCR